MKKSEIKAGHKYVAKVSNKLTTVRVDEIEQTEDWVTTRKEKTVYHVTNTATGRKTTFKSAAKFRREVKP